MAPRETIAALLEAAVARGEIAGAVALVAEQGEVEVHAAGVQDLDARTPMALAIRFQALAAAAEEIR